MTNFQPLLALILTFIANVIRSCDGVDFGRVDFDVSHFKNILQNVIGLTLVIAQPNTEPILCMNFIIFMDLFTRLIE